MNTKLSVLFGLVAVLSAVTAEVEITLGNDLANAVQENVAQHPDLKCDFAVIEEFCKDQSRHQIHLPVCSKLLHAYLCDHITSEDDLQKVLKEHVQYTVENN